MTELRIAAVGGQGFHVFAPPGHVKVGSEIAKDICPLIHESDQMPAITSSKVLSSVKRPTGINFSAKVKGNYRPSASHELKISNDKMQSLVKQGYDFFENRFSGLVYGLGRWQKDWWENWIPLEIFDEEET